MDIKTLNQTIARLLISKKIATREQLQACAADLGPNRNIGQVLVSRGVLTPDQYRQIMSYLSNKYGGISDTPMSEPAVPAPPGDGHAPQRPVQPRPEPVRPTQPSRPAPHPPRPAPAPARPAPRPPSGQPGHRVIQPKSRKSRFQHREEGLPRSFREPQVQGQPTQPPRSIGPNSTLEEILVYGRSIRASDIHISPDSPILLRRFSRLEPACEEKLSADDIQRMIENSLDPYQLEELKTSGDLEIAETIAGHGRYRMTFAEQRFGWEFTCRVVDSHIRGFKDTGMPESCLNLTEWAQGLVLITGPLGCGKSCSMATLVEQVNRNRNEHIITIENPIELIYKPKRCQITQREVERHTLSPGNALRGALRQDPDILVVGELRDLETIRLAVSAAETGHLVFGTMNTTNATRTINRLIDSFPTNEQDIMRTMISESLRGIISQQLVPRKDGKGMVPAFEVLVVTRAVSNLIRKDSSHQIESAMVSGRNLGMVLLDHSLKQLVDQGIIEGEEAFYRATNPKNFKQFAPPELKEMLDA